MRAGLIIPDIAEVERGRAGSGGRVSLGSAIVSRSMPRNRMTSDFFLTRRPSFIISLSCWETIRDFYISLLLGLTSTQYDRTSAYRRDNPFQSSIFPLIEGLAARISTLNLSSPSRALGYFIHYSGIHSGTAPSESSYKSTECKSQRILPLEVMIVSGRK
jgi:hypothetical protein